MPDRRNPVDHDAVIASIAQEMHYPIPIVKRIYEDEFSRLEAVAKVTDYLNLFAAANASAAPMRGHA